MVARSALIFLKILMSSSYKVSVFSKLLFFTFFCLHVFVTVSRDGDFPETSDGPWLSVDPSGWRNGKSTGRLGGRVVVDSRFILGLLWSGLFVSLVSVSLSCVWRSELQVSWSLSQAGAGGRWPWVPGFGITEWSPWFQDYIDYRFSRFLILSSLETFHFIIAME